jgi:hypothetical protein
MRRLPADYGASVVTRGPWWTEEDPSLRVPRRTGYPVAVWTVGDGPNVLLAAPAPGRHDVWAPISVYLRESCTAHAIDRVGTSFADDVDHLSTAADAIGADCLVGYSMDAEVLRETARRARGVQQVFVLVPPGAAVRGHADPMLEVRVDVSTNRAEALTVADAARLLETLRTAGNQ